MSAVNVVDRCAGCQVSEELGVSVGADWAFPKFRENLHLAGAGVQRPVGDLVGSQVYRECPDRLSDAEDADGVVWDELDMVVVPAVGIVHVVDAKGRQVCGVVDAVVECGVAVEN